MKSQMKAADRSGARFVVIIGEDERQAGCVLIKPLRDEGNQERVVLADLSSRIQELLT